MTSRDSTPGGGRDPSADTPAPAAATPSLELSLEQRVARIEAALETFFDALATDSHTPAADATAEAGSGPAPAGTPSPERGESARAALREQLLAGANSPLGEAWGPEMHERLLERCRVAEFEHLSRWLVAKLDALPDDEVEAASKRLEEALLAEDAPRTRAEALAAKLLLRRDGEALRWYRCGAACWDWSGRLVGTGATRAEALRDAVEHEGPEPSGAAWLTAEVPPESDELMATVAPALRRLAALDEASGDAAAWQLAEALYRRLETMQWYDKLTVPEARKLVEEALADLRDKGGDE